MKRVFLIMVAAVVAFGSMVGMVEAGTPVVTKTDLGQTVQYILTNSQTGAGKSDTLAVSWDGGESSTDWVLPEMTILAHQTVGSSMVFIPLSIWAVGGGDSLSYGIQTSFDGTNWLSHTSVTSIIEPTANIDKVIDDQPRHVRFIIKNDLSSAGGTGAKLFITYPKRNAF